MPLPPSLLRLTAAALCGLAAHAWAQEAEVAPELRSEVSRLAEEAATQRDGQQTGLRVKVEVGQLDPRLHLAPCQRIQPYLPPGLPAWGRTRIGLKCTQGAKPWNISVPVTVHVFRQAMVLRDALPGGTELDAGQLVPDDILIALIRDKLADADWLAMALSGLPPVRAGRFLTEKAPNPRSSTRSPRAIAATISSRMALTMFSTSR